MSGFWDRRLAEIKGPTEHAPSHQGPLGYSPPPDQQPRYVQQQLAVRRGVPGETEVAQHIQREGYIRKPPEWVQRQPHDTCPNCSSPDLAAVSNGGYSRPGMPGTILRCFDCGYSSGRGMMTSMWGLPSSGPVVGSAIQSRDGQVSLRNTGVITG